MTTRHEGEKAGGNEGARARAAGLRTFLPFLFFFAFGFIYLWLVVEPNLIYSCFGTILPDAPQFATGAAFLRNALASPGGPATYVSGFLSQGFYDAWLGAAIVVLVGFCLSELTRRRLAAIGFVHASMVATVPTIAFFLIYSHYKHPLTLGVVVSLGLFLSLIVERLPLRHSVIRVASCCLAAAVGFWLGGGGTLLVFAAMIVVDVLHRACTPSGRKEARGALWELLVVPASVVIVWAFARYLFLIPMEQAMFTLTPFAPVTTVGMTTFVTVLIFVLYAFVPISALLALIGQAVFGVLRHEPAVSSKARGRDRRATPRRWWLSPGLAADFAAAVAPIVLMALGLYFTHDALRKPYVLSNYYCDQRRWDRMIELGRRLPRGRNNVYVNHDTLRALYHTGRLPYDMFQFPLIPESLLLTHENEQSDLTQWKLSDILLELGHVNMAQKLASELVTTKGHLGAALEELGWIGIVKGQPETAKVYLNALRRDLVYRGRADTLLRGLDEGFEPELSAAIDSIRACMPDDTAGVTGAEGIDEMLAGLLKRNPRNKMAFEYLMACYLLSGRVEKIAGNVGRLRDLGYSKIPTLYEEAILIHLSSQGRQVDLAKYPISVETLQRYESFAQLTNLMQGQDRQAVLNRLIRDFGTSYFFYYTFGRVGLT